MTLTSESPGPLYGRSSKDRLLVLFGVEVRGIFSRLCGTFVEPFKNIEIPTWDPGKADCLAFSFSR